MPKTFRVFRVFSQWRRCEGGWCFVPFSIWWDVNFYGLVLCNYCFEWPRNQWAKDFQANA